MGDYEFMGVFKRGDFEFAFEYETIEEFKEYMKIAQETYKEIEEKPFNEDLINKNTIIAEENMEIKKAEKMGVRFPHNQSHQKELTFADLELNFIASKRKSDKVRESSYSSYATAFDKLKKYFKNRPLVDLTIQDYEEHRDYYKDKLKATTVNNHMGYLNLFLDYAVTYGWIDKNHSKGIENLKEEQSPKENFTDEEIREFLNFRGKQIEYKKLIEIGIYSGMRIGEIIALKPENIKEEKGIYYFDLTSAKTFSGIRKVPIHSILIEKGCHDPQLYPLLGNKTENAGGKAVNRLLKKIIPELEENKNKTFHSFRGTAISKMSNKHSDKINVIQEIVGHSRGDKSLTLDTYAKGFDLDLKKEVIESISYFK
ncbi:MAG: site-specific integrase [Campylobacterales bacterium]|nr:site-specific integrase [Campylobacterales bacterium]